MRYFWRRAPVLLFGGVIATGAPCMSQTVWGAELPLTFHYSEPTNWSGAFSCVGVLATDLGIEQCFALSHFGIRLYTGVEADLFPRAVVLGLPLYVVPDVQVEYTQADPDHQYFTDATGQSYSAPGQTLLRMAIGLSTRFTDRGRWGEAITLKIGAACLLSEPLDLNERRRGCDEVDLDNWFVKGSVGQSMRFPGLGISGYFRAEAWFEMPDHDFASTPLASPRVQNSYNDDGQHVLITNAMQYVFIPVGDAAGISQIDLRLGGGLAYFRQHPQNADAQPDPKFRVPNTITTPMADLLVTWNPSLAFSASAGARISAPRRVSEQSSHLSPYWTGQLFIEWRPGVSVF